MKEIKKTACQYVSGGIYPSESGWRHLPFDGWKSQMLEGLTPDIIEILEGYGVEIESIDWEENYKLYLNMVPA
ncbi:hypothetical protein PMPD1_0917 [Paramixta manurensis]|uniref:Uncharacterized protein n=1 Tax=Paramixta manurensis TaxID=2740817 RepID=A0A6M8U5C7_9GAMM|nr:hypothetical protein PMPD1_0917 [Erwiniaceae bacterium PD-1]